MKKLLAIIFLFSSVSMASNVITNPSSNSDNIVTPTVSDIPALTVNGSSGTTHGALEVYNSQDWDAAQGFSTNGAGVYAHSDNFAGVFGESANGVSGYFSSNSATNSSDIIQAADVNFNSLMSVDHSGAVHASSGLELPSTGSCDASHRRFLKVVEGSSGVADAFQVCLKDASNNYSWVTK